MSFIKKAASVFSTRLAMIFLALISSIIVNRLLGPTNRGALEILTTIPALVVNIGSLGIGNANLYFVGKKRYDFGTLLSQSLGTALFLGFFLLAVTFIFQYSFRNSLFSGIPTGCIILSFSLIPLFLLEKLIQYLFLGKELIYFRNKIILLNGILYFFCVLILVWIFRMGLYGVIYASLLGSLLTALYYLNSASKMALLCIKLKPSLFIESVKYGIVPFLALVVMNLNYKIDIFLIKYFLTNQDLGYYGLSVSLAEKIWLLPQSIGLILFVKVSNIGEDEANLFTPKATRVTLFVAMVLGLFLTSIGPWIIPCLYGKEFAPAVESFLLLLPGIVLMTLFLVLHGDLAGRGKAKYALWIFSVALAMNIILNLWWIPVLGINGAALSSSLTYAFGSITLAAIASKIYSVPLREIVLIQREDIKELSDVVTPALSRVVSFVKRR